MVNDYHYQVFPYYTFQIYDSKTSNEDFFDIRILILDYINFNVTIYKKDEVEKIFLIDNVDVRLINIKINLKYHKYNQIFNKSFSKHSSLNQHII